MHCLTIVSTRVATPTRIENTFEHIAHHTGRHLTLVRLPVCLLPACRPSYMTGVAYS